MGIVTELSTLSIPNVITVIFFASVFICAIAGLLRGFMRQTVRALTVIASAILSYATASTLYTKVLAYLDGKTLGEVIDSLGVSLQIEEGYKALISSIDTASLEGVLFILFAIFILPILFTVCFMIISGVFVILHKIICAILGFKRSKNNLITRVLGMALGALQGALIAAILLFPVTNAAAVLTDAPDMKNEEANAVISYAKQINQTPIASLSMKLGGEAIAKSLATGEIDGEKYDAREGVKLFLDIYSDVRELDGFAYTIPTEKNKATINGIEDKLFSDAFIKNTVSGLLREFALAIDSGRLVVNLDEPYGEMLHSAISIFKDSSSENVEPDMQTMLNIYFILADSGALNALSVNSENLRDVLLNDEGEGTVISRVIDELSLNERTKPITTMLAKMTLSIMSESLELGVDAEETYDTVVDCLTDISKIDPDLTEEEYTEAVSDIITDTLEREDIGIELDEAIIDDMAKYVYDEYRGVELSDEEINDILLSYFEAYANNFT